MKVIFLDFDGVINNWNNDFIVDYDNVKYLLEIIKETGAKIVATSSNKYSFQVNGIKYENSNYYKYVVLLKDFGIEIFDVIPYVNKNREEEILTYLKEHSEISEFLILDDEYVGERLKEHQVFLDLYNGICYEHIIPSINILNGILGFYPKNFNFDETLEERIIRYNEYYSKKRENNRKIR